MRIEAIGPRPGDDVWSLYTSPGSWSSWAPQIRSVHCDADPIRPGARGVVRGPFPVRVPFEIVAVDEAALTWTWRVGIGPVGVVLDHGVRAEGSGSCAWADVHAPAALVLPYRPIARLALRRLVA